jgi:hypothetical protein
LCGLTLSIGNKDSTGVTAIVSTTIASEKGMTVPEINLEIYPNPVVDIVHVTGLEGVHTVKIINAVGQVVVLVKGTSTELELDMSGKPSGMYLIKIELQGKYVTRKLIKK